MITKYSLLENGLEIHTEAGIYKVAAPITKKDLDIIAMAGLKLFMHKAKGEQKAELKKTYKEVKELWKKKK